MATTAGEAPSVISYQEALDKILSIPFTPGMEDVRLMEAGGRFLAAPVTTPWPLPRFTNSAMDGYAVHHRDIEGATEDNPVTLDIVGESAAGNPYSGTVAQGAALRISTGARLPDGPTAIVPREKAEEITEGTTRKARLSMAVPEGAFIRQQGSDVAGGADLFGPGTRVSPPVLALLASYNFAKVTVFRRPRVGILTSGEEIKPHGTPLGEGEIIGSSLYFLQRELEACGCQAKVFGISPDDPEAFRQAMSSLLEWSDVAITTAGVSVGDHDVVGAALKALGAEVLFWKVAVRPGKPMLLATVGEKPWFGLPGNPVSTCCNTEIFIKPFFRQAFGFSQPVAGYETRTLLDDCPRDRHRLFFVYAESGEEHGVAGVRPYANQSSGNPLNPARADALIVLAAGNQPAHRGTEVSTLRLHTGL